MDSVLPVDLITRPVYGVLSDDAAEDPTIVVNRFGAEYGHLIWHVALDYPGSGSGPSRTVNTVYRLQVPSTAGDGWVASGVREAKSIVAAELLPTAREVQEAAERTWDPAVAQVEAASHTAQRLVTGRGTGWVIDLDTAVVGLVGVDLAVERIGCVNPITRTSPDAR